MRISTFVFEIDKEAPIGLELLGGVMTLWRPVLWWCVAVGPWLAGCSGCEDAAGPTKALEDGGRDGSVSGEDDGAVVDALDADTPDAEAAPTDEQLAAAFEAAPLFRSGTRLRARRYEAEGTRASFAGFHDTELDVDCSLRRADDGDLRCMPQSGDFEVAFSDPTCTEPLLRGIGVNAAECATGDPSYVVGQVDDGRGRPDCGPPRARAYRATAKLANAAPYQVVDKDCEPAATTRCAFELEPVPASAFVRAELAVEPRGAALEQTIVRFEDGAELASTLRDVARDADCEPSSFIPGYCVPVNQSHHSAGPTAGATCDGEDVAIESGAACGLATIIVHWEPDCSGYAHSLFERGAPVSVTSTRDAEGMCVASSSEGGDPQYTLLGAAIDPSTLPALGIQRLGNDRLALRYYATPDLVPVSYGDLPYFDVSLDAACSPLALREGYVCAPLALPTSSWGPYEDDACTTPVAGATTSFLPCDAELPAFIKRHNSGTQTEHWFRRGPQLEPSDGRLFSLNQAGACEPYEADPSYAYFLLGAPIELAPIALAAE